MGGPFEHPGVPPFLDGLYLGVNAVPDARLVIDAPVGCYYKQERLALNHDLGSDLFDPLGEHRIAQTGIDYGQLAFGTEGAVRARVREVVRRTQPRIVFLTEVSMTLMASNDLPSVARELSGELGLPVVHVRPRPFDGDWLDGWEAFLEALVAGLADPVGRGLQTPPRIPSQTPPQAPSVAVVGYRPDRLEADHRANLDALRAMVEGLGLSWAGALCDGRPTTDLGRVATADLLVALPDAGRAAALLAGRSGATVVPALLPVGLGGTSAFVRALGAAAGRTAEAEAWLDRELSRVVPVLDRVAGVFLQDRSVAVAADPAWASGIAGFLGELGMDIALVAARTRSAARARVLADALSGLPVPPEVVHDTGDRSFRDALARVAARRPLAAAVASSEERVPVEETGAGFVEFGYPSYVHHALFPRPFLGPDGALRLAEEVVDAVRRGELRRNLGRAWPDGTPAVD